MPLSLVSLPSVWDIPVAVGVPALLGQSIGAGASASASTVLGSLLDDYLVSQAAQQWGIFDASNSPVLTSGRVRALDVQSQYRISDAPLENGSFASYNKVRIPGQYMVEMLCDGSSTSLGNSDVIDTLISAFDSNATSSGQQGRTSFLAALDGVVADLNLYHVTTPEATYANVNVVGYHLRREARRGVTLLWADVLLQEVRLTPSNLTTSVDTAQPQGQAQQNGGNVQSQAIESGELSPVTPAGYF
ncbi:hypothetical protein K2X14_11625 [Acetobacter sp. TBRC 12305]|uniref:Uncharacterized protein n=1 Tax=Acetobacter garciniae TaxID=2817435 RepID=A0A939HJ20_9PROT|nr:hypothetical protein [Acetobacter garciniae]MBO1325340.1 hypothetical protein [Acetobacter garciniae]MBX0345488.1 hypothetical protein [Acetobacter garciniae]